MDDATGTIDPNNQTNIKGMHFVAEADLVVLFTRFRELPDDQMKFLSITLRLANPSSAFVPPPTRFPTVETSRVPTSIITGKAVAGPEDSASRCWAKPGSIIMVTTDRKALAV